MKIAETSIQRAFLRLLLTHPPAALIWYSGHGFIGRRRYTAPADDFNLTFDRRRFLVDTQRRRWSFISRGRYILFFLFFTPFSIAPESSRHVLLADRRSSDPIQFRKNKRVFLFFYFSSNLVQIFTYEFFFFVVIYRADRK